MDLEEEKKQFSKNEQAWNLFWDEMCTDYWGKALNPYLPQASIRKIMNKYEIKLKENDIPNERIY
jgi:hypothetical protein